MTLHKLLIAGTLTAIPCSAMATIDMFAGLSNQMLGVDAITVASTVEFELLQDVVCEIKTFEAGTIYKGAVEYDFAGSDWRLYSYVEPTLTTAMHVEAIKHNGELTCIDYEAGYANTIPMTGSTEPEGGFLRVPVFSVYDYLTPFDQDSLIAPTVPAVKSAVVQTASAPQTWAAVNENGRQIFTTNIDLGNTHGIDGQSLTIATLQAEPERPFRYDYIDEATGNTVLRIEFSNYQTIISPNNDESTWPMSIVQTVYGPNGQPAVIATYTVQTVVVNDAQLSADRIANRTIPEGIQKYYENTPIAQGE